MKNKGFQYENCGKDIPLTPLQIYPMLCIFLRSEHFHNNGIFDYFIHYVFLNVLSKSIGKFIAK